MIRVDLLDPPAYTPPYDHALAAALGRSGAEVRLITSKFAYGSVPEPVGYEVREHFYRGARGKPGSRLRQAWKLGTHIPDMLSYEGIARDADVVHVQWLALPTLDVRMLPDRPLLLTAHDLLPREPRFGQVRAQRRLYQRAQAIVVHSQSGARRLIDDVGVEPEKVHVIHHGAFEHLTRQPDEQPLPDELQGVDRPVVLFFGLLRPYKGIEVLLEAWRGIGSAELWIVGNPRMEIRTLRAGAPPSVRFIPRFVPDNELPAFFRRADLVVLPYTRTERFDQSGVLAAALAFGKPLLLSDVGGFSDVAAMGAGRLVTPDDPAALRSALADLIGDPAERERLARAARAAADDQYSWDSAARATLELYATILRA